MWDDVSCLISVLQFPHHKRRIKSVTLYEVCELYVRIIWTGVYKSWQTHSTNVSQFYFFTTAHKFLTSFTSFNFISLLCLPTCSPSPSFSHGFELYSHLFLSVQVLPLSGWLQSPHGLPRLSVLWPSHSWSYSLPLQPLTSLAMPWSFHHSRLFHLWN